MFRFQSWWTRVHFLSSICLDQTCNMYLSLPLAFSLLSLSIDRCSIVRGEDNCIFFLEHFPMIDGQGHVLTSSSFSVARVLWPLHQPVGKEKKFLFDHSRARFFFLRQLAQRIFYPCRHRRFPFCSSSRETRN